MDRWMERWVGGEMDGGGRTAEGMGGCVNPEVASHLCSQNMSFKMV